MLPLTTGNAPDLQRVKRLQQLGGTTAFVAAETGLRDLPKCSPGIIHGTPIPNL
jgi:hypothetical protein